MSLLCKVWANGKGNTVLITLAKARFESLLCVFGRRFFWRQRAANLHLQLFGYGRDTLPSWVV